MKSILPCARSLFVLFASLMVCLPVHQSMGQMMSPLPPGFVFQVTARTNAGSAQTFTPEELHLPPLPSGLVFTVVPKPTNTSELISLFATAADARPSTAVTNGSRVKRSRTTLLSPAWAGSASRPFGLNLFDDATYLAVPEKTERAGASFVSFCRLEGVPQGRLILARHGRAVAGSVRFAGKTSFAIEYQGGGLHQVRELAPADFASGEPQCGGGLQALATETAAIEAARSSPQTETSMDVGGPTTVDVMVVYTPATTGTHGGPDGAAALIALAVAEVNEVFENSLVNARLRLIHQQEVQYAESGDSNLQTDYDRLYAPQDGYLDEVPLLGAAWGADLTSLWLTHPNAQQSRGDVLTQNRPSRYTVVIARCAPSTGEPGRWHFAHELGHNLGCYHSWSDPGNGDRYYPWSLGNWQICEPPCGPDGGFSDIMAFMFEPLLPYFSNPQVSYHHPEFPDPCPTGFGVGDCPCDCAGTMNDTAPIVAAYGTPTFLIQPRIAGGGQQFQFELRGPAGAACRVEASSDLATWVFKGSVTLSGDGTGSFTDEQAGGAAHRFYRIRPAQ